MTRTLTKKNCHRSRWSIPKSLTNSEIQSSSLEEETEFNTQIFQERLDKLRNEPYQAKEEWSSSHNGAWGGAHENWEQTVTQDNSDFFEFTAPPPSY